MEVKHKTIFGLNIDAIRLKDFGRDENCLKGENKLGEKFEDHTFLLHNHYFDHISLRVWETDFDKPEYVKLEKNQGAVNMQGEIMDISMNHYKQSYDWPKILKYYHFQIHFGNTDTKMTAIFRFSKTDKFSGLNFENISDMNNKSQGAF